MDIGILQIVGVISSSTTGYLSTYSPLFLMMAAIVLAFGVMGALIDYFFSRNTPEYLQRREDDVY